MRTSQKIVYPELSYKLTGLFFQVHNSLGRYCRERQYADAVENTFQESNIFYGREKPLPLEEIKNKFTNRVDFCVENKILVDIKAKPVVTKEDYYQILRYLDAAEYRLGLMVNFRNRYLKPIRVIRAHS